MTIENKQHTNLWLRAVTRAKFDRIAAARRWSLAETADALADFYISEHAEFADLTKPPPDAGAD